MKKVQVSGTMVVVSVLTDTISSNLKEHGSNLARVGHHHIDTSGRDHKVAVAAICSTSVVAWSAELLRVSERMLDDRNLREV
jgi:hypothetical protein